MATTYHVKTTGNDSTGDGSDGNPWLTIAKGLSTMAASDTLEIHTGTYAEHMQSRVKAGSVGAPTIVQAHGSSGAYDVVTIRPPNGGSNGATRVYYNIGRTDITLKGLILDGVNGGFSGDDCVKLDTGCHRTILQECTFQNAGGNGVLGNASNNCTVTQCTITGNGRLSTPSPQLHGIYAASTCDSWTIHTITLTRITVTGCISIRLLQTSI